MNDTPTAHRRPCHSEPPPQIPFALPKMTYFLIAEHEDRVVAHALDFDLVSVAPTKEIALNKLRLAVKYHVEFGIENGIERDILFPAPSEFWNALTPDGTLSIGEPIVIENADLLRTAYTTTDERQLSSTAA